MNYMLWILVGKVSGLYQVDANVRYFNKVLPNEKCKGQEILNM